MVSADVVRTVVGIAGNVISFGLFLAPVETFVKIYKKKAVEEFSPAPYLATLLNCMLWFLYGLPFVHPHSMLVLTINGIGLAIEAFYLISFFVFAPRKKRQRMLAVLGIEAVFMVALVLSVLLGAHTHKTRSMIVGILCAIAGSLMYAAPLTVMTTVVKTKSVEYMPFFLSFAGLLNGICWTFYALIKFDIFITIPNGLGVLFSLAQLILYVCYRKSTPKKEKNVELPTAVPKSDNAISGGNISITVEQ